VAVRAAAKEEKRIVAVNAQQVGDVMNMNPARRHRPYCLQPAKVLAEIEAALLIGGDRAFAQQVDDAERILADTVIRAPFAGYVSDRPTAVGEYVSSSSVIATVLRTNPIKAIIQVPEADVPSVRLGAGVTVSVDAYKDRSFAGKVSAVNPAIDVNSRAASIEALIDNSDNLLRQGMFTSVSIVREGGSAGVFVPKTAIRSDVSTKSFTVFVIADGIAKARVVQIGREEGDWQQIISGVDADETVATSNVDQLFEGAKVSL